MSIVPCLIQATRKTSPTDNLTFGLLVPAGSVGVQEESKRADDFGSASDSVAKEMNRHRAEKGGMKNVSAGKRRTEKARPGRFRTPMSPTS
ncbi:hypothetical protein M431DRAFT_509375 [Trichoderma harzianum CBS 226.95]|uniref:Uncharacterized protein n=1 Tax=Trichoderma harzianum CBS 226.95 TaxID=983964 RepID=A0A2T4ABD0_TRIHA|nr:hypothetical protein M431DRAFT_509375 [Trichoderma harzianum CBS 226.95]PTB54389.1 hypothetical protein M431DRAFT_509375 [Trichoderma harzianum CBS 226.95]